MSGCALAEKRVARFVLWPLALAFGVAAWVSAYRGLWWPAAIYVLLVAHMGWLTSGLASYRGKLFGELRKGIALPPRPEERSEELELERERKLARTIAHAYNSVVIAAVVTALAAEYQFYWVVLIALSMLLLAPIVRGRVIYFVY